MIYNRQGLLISKYTLSELLNDGLDESEREDIYGSFLSSIEPKSKKVSKDYKIGELGLIIYEIKDYRLIFLEAGPEAIVLIITYFTLDAKFDLPYCYLLVEKVSQILENKFNLKYNTLTIPKFGIGESFEGDLMKVAEKKKEIMNFR